MALKGHCACRHVRYQLGSSPLFVHACHCTWCQRESGSAFSLNALIETERLTVLQGTTSEVLTPSASGKGQRIIRCDQCQVALWSHYAYGKLAEAIVFVRVGTLQREHQMPPDIHIFTDTKQPWFTLPTGVPIVPGYYRASEHWPKESLRRRDSLLRAVS